MYRLLWLKVGKRRLHLLKLLGVFFIAATFFKLGESSYNIFVTVEKIKWAMLGSDYALKLFGASSNYPFFTMEDALGVMMGPVASLLFWCGVLLIAFAIYQSGKIVFPLEEYEQKIAAHHKSLIEKATAKFKKK